MTKESTPRTLPSVEAALDDFQAWKVERIREGKPTCTVNGCSAADTELVWMQEEPEPSPMCLGHRAGYQYARVDQHLAEPPYGSRDVPMEFGDEGD